jgi:hypothetical protein
MKRVKIYRRCKVKWDYKYEHVCGSCGKKRMLFCKSAPNLCKSCAGKISHNNVSKETKLKMSYSKKGTTPWNKDKTGIYSEQAKANMGNKWRGQVANNKGKRASEEQKIKLSCVNRNIDIEDFDGFTTSISKKERNKFDSSSVRQQCYENANYICDLYGVSGEELNAHHLDSWHDNEDKRFELDNLACLSKQAHKTFHNIYGNKNNTKDQYAEFKEEVDKYKQTKQDVFLIAGCPASGKSWVCNQLLDKFNYVSYDNVNKNYHVYELLKNNHTPLLYDPTIKISTFTKRYGHLFNIRLVVIVEDEGTINQRILSRGGKLTETIKRRIKRMSQLSNNCEFNGTSTEVLEYLKLKGSN